MLKHTVLFVDDEPKVLNSLKRGLINEKFQMQFALSGKEALDILENHKISVIVSDMRMPGMSGLDLLKIVKEKYPQIIKIVLTGYTQLPQILATINQVDIFKFITKPWKMDEEFIPIIREAVEYYNLRQEKIILQESLEKRNVLYQNVLKNTEIKLQNIKKEYSRLKDINLLIVDYIEKKSKYESNNIPEINKSVNHFIQIINQYIDIFQSSNEHFGIDKLNEKLKGYIVSKNLEDNIDLTILEATNKKMYGNLQLCLFITQTIIETFSKNDPEIKMSIIINKEENDEKLIIEIKASNDTKAFELELSDDFDTILKIIRIIAQDKNIYAEKQSHESWIVNVLNT